MSLLSAKRVDHPAGRLAIVDTDEFLSSDGNLDVHLQGTLELHYKCAFHALREGGHARRCVGIARLLIFFDSAAGLERFLDDFVGSFEHQRPPA